MSMSGCWACATEGAARLSVAAARVRARAATGRSFIVNLLCRETTIRRALGGRVPEEPLLGLVEELADVQLAQSPLLAGPRASACSAISPATTAAAVAGT